MVSLGVRGALEYIHGMPFEHHRQPLASRGRFARRLLKFAGFGLAFLAVSLLLGVAGYHWIGGLAWVDFLVRGTKLPLLADPYCGILSIPVLLS